MKRFFPTRFRSFPRSFLPSTSVSVVRNLHLKRELSLSANESSLQQSAKDEDWKFLENKSAKLIRNQKPRKRPVNAVSGNEESKPAREYVRALKSGPEIVEFLRRELQQLEACSKTQTKTESGMVLDASVFGTAIVECWKWHSDWKSCADVWKLFGESPIEIDLVAYNVWLNGCAECGQLQAALNTFNDCLIGNARIEEISQATVSSVLKACAPTGRMDTALLLWQLAKGKWPILEPHLYAAMLKVCAQCSDWKMADELFSEMAVSDLLNDKLFTALVRVYARSPQCSVRRIEECDELRRAIQLPMDSLMAMSLANAYSRRGHFTKARESIAEWLSSSQPPAVRETIRSAIVDRHIDSRVVAQLDTWFRGDKRLVSAMCSTVYLEMYSLSDDQSAEMRKLKDEFDVYYFDALQRASRQLVGVQSLRFSALLLANRCNGWLPLVKDFEEMLSRKALWGFWTVSDQPLFEAQTSSRSPHVRMLDVHRFGHEQTAFVLRYAFSQLKRDELRSTGMPLAIVCGKGRHSLSGQLINDTVRRELAAFKPAIGCAPHPRNKGVLVLNDSDVDAFFRTLPVGDYSFCSKDVFENVPNPPGAVLFNT